MLWCVRLGIAGVLLALVCSTSHAGEIEGLKLTITMDRTEFRSDEPILVKVELLNTSDRSMTVYRSLILEDRFLRFKILDSDKQRIRFVGVEREPKAEYLSIIELEPMAFFGQVINLREGGNINRFNKGEKLYQIDKKGTYQVQAVYEVIKRKNTWRGTLVSNELTFTIQ